MRYRAAKSLVTDTEATFRDLIPTKLASEVWNCLSKYRETFPNYPTYETCELLILDRSVDQVIPFSLLLLMIWLCGLPVLYGLENDQLTFSDCTYHS